MKIRCTSAVLHLALMMDFARLFISLFLDNITFQEIKRVIFVQGTYYTESKYDITVKSSNLPNPTVSQGLLSGIGSYRTAIVSVE